MNIKQLIDVLEEIRSRRGDDYRVQIEVGEYPDSIYPDEEITLLETQDYGLVFAWSFFPDYELDQS